MPTQAMANGTSACTFLVFILLEALVDGGFRIDAARDVAELLVVA